jgi:hypothetical protein
MFRPVSNDTEEEVSPAGHDQYPAEEFARLASFPHPPFHRGRYATVGMNQRQDLNASWVGILSLIRTMSKHSPNGQGKTPARSSFYRVIWILDAIISSRVLYIGRSISLGQGEGQKGRRYFSFFSNFSDAEFMQ